MTRRRFPIRERARRILKRIYDAGGKGTSVREIARRERLSTRRVRYLVNLIRRAQRDRGGRIMKLGRRFYYPRTMRDVPGIDPGPIFWQNTQQYGKLVELRGYVSYTSSLRESRNINTDCVKIVRYDNASIISGSEEIKDLVEGRLGHKIASMLKFGVSEATASSANHFLFRRGRGDWVEF